MRGEHLMGDVIEARIVGKRSKKEEEEGNDGYD